MNYIIDYFYNNNNFFDDTAFFPRKHYNHLSTRYTIEQKAENKFLLQIELPGYDKNNIEVEASSNTLNIMSKKGNKDNCLLNSFNIQDDIVVKDAVIKNGLLDINLIRKIPEKDKPKLITIN